MVDIAINVLEGSMAVLHQPHQVTVIGQPTIKVPAFYTPSLPSTNTMEAGRLLSQSWLQQHGQCRFKFNAGANWGWMDTGAGLVLLKSLNRFDLPDDEQPSSPKTHDPLAMLSQSKLDNA